jgi:GTPase Era involved in 16S rRNA processing
MESVMEITQTLLEQLSQMRVRVTEKGDSERAEKIDDLLRKLQRRKADFTFCGHFSAGKSSLINRLCGASILPSSPIPTSANVVLIENGEEDVIVEQADTGEKHVTLAELDEACRDGAEIRRVHIRYPVPRLKDAARLLDTPGVDSTDDLHRKATEDALHMADAIFYVMDYNHVLSEMNFHYIRKLAEFGKPLYLIVNQIDKHRAEELSFASFQERVYEALNDWKLSPQAVFFVSVKRPEDPNNEWELLTQLIDRLVTESHTLLTGGVLQAALQLIREHEEWLREQQKELREQLTLTTQASDSADETADGISPELLEQELRALEAAYAQLGDPARQELQKILNNANVIPAPSRDIAQQYLETKKAGFRVGLLFSERKTQTERERRRSVWREEVERQADAHVRWHVTDYVKQLIEQLSLQGEAADAAISLLDSLHFQIEESRLDSLVIPGGHFDDTYTLQYAKTVAEEIKGQYRKKLWDVLDQLQELVRPIYEERRSAIQSRLTTAQKVAEAQGAIRHLDDELAQYIDILRSSFRELLTRGISPSMNELHREVNAELKHFRNGRQEQERTARTVQAAAASTITDRTMQADAIPSELRISHGAQMKLQAAAKRLRRASELLDELPVFNGFARTLRDKSERLEHNQYTIALFGAFSAGKSSFANALLHTRVLPVSPNPTTAAINSVLPPSEANPSGYARLHYKSQAAMAADIRLSLEKLQVKVPDRNEELITAIERADLSKAAAGAKVHVAFLNAVRKGWERYGPKLGTNESVDTETYRHAVADESHACFLESVDLYIDSAFAEAGMILVDTPGADSINARHTGVAFNYIKNADAILFVTYYNHAFSHADREFLLQLGRVKDTFALNKMFFIVNAADLASSEKELDEVVEHVRSNLAVFGIREPRIYPVSSLRASESLAAGDAEGYERSGMRRFESEFYSFVQEELAEMSIRSGEQELIRSSEALSEWIRTMREAMSDREARAKRTKEGIAAAKNMLARLGDTRRIDDLAKEIQELIYYAAQRVTYRYGELYNLAFNSSTFAEAGLSDKDKLSIAYRELLQYLAFDYSQELRATTLRVEAFMNRMLTEIEAECARQLADMLQGFSAPERTIQEWSAPSCEAELAEAADEWKAVRSAYRNNRQFFEQGGKATLKNELETLLQERIKRLAQLSQEAFIEHYREAFRQASQALAGHLEAEAVRYAEGMLKAFESNDSLELYEERMQALQCLISG